MSKIDWDKFTETYPLQKNTLVPDSPFDGTMFETFGKEHNFVLAQPADRIWTLKDVEGSLIVEKGYHFVDRLGYFIGVNPAPKGEVTFDYA